MVVSAMKAIQWPKVTNSVTTPTSIPGLGLAHPMIYPICDLMEYVEELVLRNESHSIPMTGAMAGYPRGISMRVQ